MFKSLFKKKDKNLSKIIPKQIDHEIGVCVLYKNSGDFYALAFNKALDNCECTLGICDNFRLLSEKDFTNKMIELFEIAAGLNLHTIDNFYKKNSGFIKFTKDEYKAYINEYKKNLENGWHILSLKAMPHYEEYDKYVNCKTILRYGWYNKYRMSDKFLVCEVRPLSATCNKLLAYPRDDETFSFQTLENSMVYKKISEILNRKHVENVSFLENNYTDIDVCKYSFADFENEKNKKNYFHLSISLYVQENGNFIGYSDTNNRQSSLTNYINGNFNEVTDEELSKIIIKLFIDALNENDFLEDMQIDKKDNLVDRLEIDDYKKDKSISAKWFKLSITNNHPNKVNIILMKRMSSTEWGGGSRHAVLMDINTSFVDIIAKMRELYEYKKGLLLTKADVKGNILKDSFTSHFAIKEILSKHDFEHIDELGVSAIGFDLCANNEKFIAYPFVYKGNGKMYLNRERVCERTNDVTGGIFTIVDFALNDAIYYDLKGLEFANVLEAEDKLEVKLCNLEKDNKYNITVFEKGKKANTKVIARTKILDVFAFIQDYYSK